MFYMRRVSLCCWLMSCGHIYINPLDWRGHVEQPCGWGVYGSQEIYRPTSVRTRVAWVCVHCDSYGTRSKRNNCVEWGNRHESRGRKMERQQNGRIHFAQLVVHTDLQAVVVVSGLCLVYNRCLLLMLIRSYSRPRRVIRARTHKDTHHACDTRIHSNWIPYIL